MLSLVAAVSLASLSLAAALPEGAVVLGVSTAEGTATTVRVVAPDGAAREVAVVAHTAGAVPLGVVVGHDLLLTVDRAGAAASVVRVSLTDGAMTDVAEGALSTVPPIPLDDGVAFIRRGATPTSFEVAVARGAVVEVAATIEAATVTPVRGARGLVLLVTSEKGVFRIVRVEGGAAVEVAALGKGPIRAPCDEGTRIVVERDVPTPIDRKPLADVRARALGKARVASASLVDVGTGKTIAKAVQAGMSPACGDGVVAYTTGAKDGTLELAAGARPTQLRTGKKGVARPQAVGVVDGKTVVVVRMDLGAALPPETWLIDDGGRAARLADPAPGAVAQVYGLTRAAPPTPAAGTAPR